jgi:hypothetical protein
MEVKFTGPKKELGNLVTELRYARETAQSVVLPMLAGLIAVTLRHAATKGVIDGEHPDPTWRGKGKYGRPAGWRFKDRQTHPVPGADVGVDVVVDLPRDAKGHFQWETKPTAVFDSKKIVSRTGSYRRALLNAAADLERGDYHAVESELYGTGRGQKYCANLEVVRIRTGSGLVLEVDGVWAMLEAPTSNAPRGRQVIGQRMRNNRKALTRLLEKGNPWGLAQNRKKWDGWKPKTGGGPGGYGAVLARETA